MNRPVFIINFKNYSEILGEGAARLAKTAEVVSETLLIRGDKSVLLGAAVDIMSTAKRPGPATLRS